MTQRKRTGTRKKAGKKSANLKYSVPTKNTKGGIYPNGALGNDRLMERVCALTNPFCPEARGSKIPDDDSAYSIPCTMTSTFEVTTDANGDAAFSMQPALASVFKTSPVTGTTATAWTGAAAMKDYTALLASADQYRIVSMGVRVYSVLAPTNQSGYCRIMTAPEAFADGVDLDGGLWEAVETYPVSELDCHVVLKPQGNEWKQYIDTPTAANYNYVAAIVKGAAASSTAFIVEITIHIEFLVNIGNITASIATPGAPSSPQALAAASRVHASHKGIHNTSTPTLGSKLLGFAKNALLDVAATAIPFIGNSVANLFRPKRSYPMIVD